MFLQISKYGFNVSRDWVEACTQFCNSQIPAPKGPALVNAIVEQWMNTDITVEGTQSTPQIPTTINKDVVKGPKLEGKFCLQVQKAIDIGQNSAYSQLQTELKIRNENTLVSADIDTQRPYTAAWEPKSKRMLKMTLTDGFRTVDALEFEPIAQLNYPVPPGLKLEVNGPIMVRRGILLLTPKNVRILGGRVSDLEDKCSLVQQLTDILGLENLSSLLNQHKSRPVPVQPRVATHISGNEGDMFNDDEDDLFNAIEDPPPVMPSLPATTSHYSRPSGFSGGNQSSTAKKTIPAKQTKTSQTLKKESQTSQKRVPKISTINPLQVAKAKPAKSSVWDDDDDDDLVLCAAAQLESGLEGREFVKTEKFSQTKSQSGIQDNFSHSKHVPSLSKFPPRVGQISDDNGSAAKKMKHNPNPSVTEKPSSKISKVKTEDPWSSNSHDDDDSSAAIVSSVPDVMMTQSSAPSSQHPQSKPYTYLRDIPQNVDCVEVVKGCIVSLASKLTIGEDATGKVWRVKVTFVDGTGKLTATLASSMITETFGFTPLEYLRMPSDRKKPAMTEAASRMSSKLLNFNGLVRLKFENSNSEPEIIEFIPFNRGHLQQLKNRVSKTK